MSENINKRIAYNTILLYVRMLFLMAISFYTSRVIINALGVEDFGIYNIVGGVVVILSFLNGAMSTSTQRFLSYEIGRDGKNELTKTFSMCINCHFIISVLVIVLAETIGLWFVNYKLNIPIDRMFAANIVYQLSILTFIVSIIQVPYNSSIISYERMSFFALISIIEGVFKLGIVFLLRHANFDRLIFYAFLLLAVSILFLIFRYIYCKMKCPYCTYSLSWNNQLFQSIMGFSGWSMCNACANISAQQGGNILVNIFDSVSANAAYGIANQVSSAVYSLVSNFQTAFQPQIVKQYAQKQNDSLRQLIFTSSKLSFYLILVVAIPFCYEADWILKIWLGDVPKYSAIFCQLMITYFIIDALQAPIWMLIYATGKIKGYTIWSGIITFANIPVSYYLLYIGLPIYYVFVTRVGLNILTSIIRVGYLKPFMNFPIKDYLEKVILRISLVVGILAFMVTTLSNVGILDSYHFVNIIIIVMNILILIVFLGLAKNERKFLVSLITKRRI